ncbi:hypothetical protein [Streptomyces sp. NPDC047014]|uniref:hypothetical protein n=1 Tax=Streptomyces sp. NPDC047014 TaxID=3155736 RepID=UPI0033E03156
MSFEESVRAHPAKYFGVGRDSPELPTEILQRVVEDALHHPGDGTHGRIVVEIASDLCFTVRDDRPPAAGEGGTPRPAFHDSRRAPAAAAALSTRTVVEVRRQGRGHRRELAGTVPAGAPEEFPAPGDPDGTRTTFHLDPAYIAPGEAIAWALRPEELHAGHCRVPLAPADLVIHDLRADDAPPRPPRPRNLVTHEQL